MSLNLCRSPKGEFAFSRLEILVIVLVLGVVIAVAFFALSDHRDKLRRGHTNIHCVMNLKQIGLAQSIFADDHDGTTPDQAFADSTKNPRQVWVYFQNLSNELQSAKILLCPADKTRSDHQAENFEVGTNATFRSLSTHGNLAVSYFVGQMGKNRDPRVIVAGDRNLADERAEPAYSSVTKGGSVTISPTAQWSTHANNPLHGEYGNVLMGDGSVWTLTDNKQLRSQLSDTAAVLETNRLQFRFPQ